MSELFFGIISVVVAIASLVLTRVIINSKLRDLQGSDKLTGIISVGIVISEVVYLGGFFGLFDFAIEAITSIGAAAVVLGIAFQNQLKNAISGISIFLNPQINVGDILEFAYTRGTIIGIHLTKTEALTEDGRKMYIPNHQFSEEMVMILPKRQKSLKK